MSGASSSRGSHTSCACEERPDADRADLFSGWRLFFERLSQDAPVTLVFEDLQWADSGLLDFIDYLLEWSAEYPIFVITLARPELHERRPAWPPLLLEPLATAAIETMLEGLAPGLPARARLRDRTPGRGDPPVRRGDDPDAAGPRDARAGGVAIRRVRRHLGPRRSRDAAGARRLPARRSLRR